jgi:hypothetical protein
MANTVATDDNHQFTKHILIGCNEFKESLSHSILSHLYFLQQFIQQLCQNLNKEYLVLTGIITYVPPVTALQLPTIINYVINLIYNVSALQQNM